VIGKVPPTSLAAAPRRFRHAEKMNKGPDRNGGQWNEDEMCYWVMIAASPMSRILFDECSVCMVLVHHTERE